MIITLTLFHFYFFPFLLQIVSNTTSLTKKNHTYFMLKTNLFLNRTSKCRNCNGNMFVRNTLRNCPGCGLCSGGGVVGGNLDGDDDDGDGDDGDDQSKSRGRKDSGVGL